MTAMRRRSTLLTVLRTSHVTVLGTSRAHFSSGLIFSLFVGAFGCGRVTSSEPRSANNGAASELGSSGVGGGGGGAPDEAAGVFNDTAGSAGSLGGDSGASGVDAGAGGSTALESPAVSARPKSGTTFCLYDSDCDGLTCTASMGRVQSACLAPCASDLNCKPTERCFSQPSIPTSCFQRCVSPEDCDDQFDCADYYRTGEYTCLPSDWVRYWTPIML
jgi:hypothetical protein